MLLTALTAVSVVLAVRVLSGDNTSTASQADPEVAQSSSSPYPTATSTASAPAGQGCVPTSLSIAEINVDTQVSALGIDSEGRQRVPNNPTEASWWKDGAKPGQPGNAVFAGHTWSKGDGVFDRLSELKNGDIVRVHGKGCALTFQVNTILRHVPTNLSSQQVEALYSTEGPSGLVLITCGDFSDGVYHSKIVVKANLTE